MSHDDYQPVPPSERHQVARQLVAWARESGLKSPERQPRRDRFGRYYAVDWAAGETAHGTVYVYGATYFKVWYHADRPGLPRNDTRLYAAAEEVMAFLSLAFIDGVPATALEIPQRQPRQRRPT